MTAEGTPPDRFAIEHAHYVEDIPFWVGLADETGGPVLDVGAAVGRVTVAIARRGIAVCALDGSQGMLDVLTASLAGEPEAAVRVTTACCDFRDIEVGRADSAFALAIMPMNSLQALLTRDDQLSCLRGIRRALRPDGVFAFDVAAPDMEAIAEALGQVQAGADWRDPDAGVRLAHSAWFDTLDPVSGTVAFTARIQERAAGGATTEYLRPHTVHLFSPSELWDLVHEAGFEVNAVYGDFDGRPFDAGAERQIYRCGVAR